MSEAEIGKQAIEYATERCGDRYEFDLLANGFVAGAKWGMEHSIEWHDLRKDPNDLPKVKGGYWTKCNDCNKEKGGYYDLCYFDPDNPAYKQRWYKLNWYNFDVIAWCELPMFEESEE